MSRQKHFYLSMLRTAKLPLAAQEAALTLPNARQHLLSNPHLEPSVLNHLIETSKSADDLARLYKRPLEKDFVEETLKIEKRVSLAGAIVSENAVSPEIEQLLISRFQDSQLFADLVLENNHASLTLGRAMFDACSVHFSWVNSWIVENQHAYPDAQLLLDDLKNYVQLHKDTYQTVKMIIGRSTDDSLSSLIIDDHDTPYQWFNLVAASRHAGAIGAKKMVQALKSRVAYSDQLSELNKLFKRLKENPFVEPKALEEVISQEGLALPPGLKRKLKDNFYFDTSRPLSVKELDLFLIYFSPSLAKEKRVKFEDRLEDFHWFSNQPNFDATHMNEVLLESKFFGLTFQQEQREALERLKLKVEDFPSFKKSKELTSADEVLNFAFGGDHYSPANWSAVKAHKFIIKEFQNDSKETWVTLLSLLDGADTTVGAFIKTIRALT